MILIGSRATYNRVPELLKRVLGNSDWDIICTPDEFHNTILGYLCENDIQHTYTEDKIHPNKYELRFNDYSFEIAATENPSNIELRKLVDKNTPTITVSGFTFKVPDIGILYATKRAHANFNVFFEKTLLDLIKFQVYFKSVGIDPSDLIKKYETFYNLRHEEAKARFGARQKRINLNVPNEKFFMKSAHCRQLDHDELHKLVGIDGKPAYLECKRDLTLAKIEKDMFFSLPLEKKIRLPIEEALVIGMEREYIANLESLDDYIEIDEQTVYRKGLIKLIRDLSKGWFQDFCLDNIAVLWNYREPWQKKLHEQIAHIKLQDFK